jgi:thiol-disulfide isomerase/thioredoxin
MICPHCNTGINFESELYRTFPHPNFFDESTVYALYAGLCPVCDDLIVRLKQGEGSEDPGSHSGYTLEETKREFALFPMNSVRPVASEVPDEYKADFIEACNVLPISPKASAALLRRLLQKLLRNVLNINSSDLAKEIEEFLQTQNAPSYLKEAVDAVRNIGNFAAHPLKSTSTGQIVDVEPGEADWLIEVTESMFDFVFVQPKRLEEKRNKLNQKLTDLGKPPMKQ